MIRYSRFYFSVVLCTIVVTGWTQEHSIARQWNEVVLQAIRNDYARPTVHARNLFHTSVAMYDAWALTQSDANTYIIGNEIAAFKSNFDQSTIAAINANRDLPQTLSHAVYTIINHRYSNSPDYQKTVILADSLMSAHGYDVNNTEVKYQDGDPAALGNFIASEIIRYGLTDGANEQNDYANKYYKPINTPLTLESKEISLNDPNRWQPLRFELFIDQAGNELGAQTPKFLSPEWGHVAPFALGRGDRKTRNRDSQDYIVYLDPGSPPLLGSDRDDEYKWGFSLVSLWSSHLDENQSVEIDISPASIGNVTDLPETFEEYKQFYKIEGGDSGAGHNLNPTTRLPYEPNRVQLGDYARILAEFWADGPDSETPPGHWFTLLNYVLDHPQFEYRYNGQQTMGALEYDIKAYFMLGGAMHDAAIAAWSVKGYYDYIRPISALRYMASLGQSSDPTLPRYHTQGIPLIDGYIELVRADDSQFRDPKDINKIKLKAWRGPNYISNPNTDKAGVDWILAETWWPYQRPSFVTPPFAGYVSGHSTYSRAAAEVLTYLTGDPYFPGGMGEFKAPKNEFLVFEDGPSQDVTLQWATYRDASDQCSLSRIWGGIHPPADDIPGRKMGIIIGTKAINEANRYFEGKVNIDRPTKNTTTVFPNPVKAGQSITIDIDGNFDRAYLLSTDLTLQRTIPINSSILSVTTNGLSSGVYTIILEKDGLKIARKLVVIN